MRLLSGPRLMAAKTIPAPKACPTSSTASDKVKLCERCTVIPQPSTKGT